MEQPALVKDLMSQVVVCVDAGDALDVVDRSMKLAHIRHIPVVDGKQHVVGMLSQVDFVRALLTHEMETPPPVSEVMTRKLTVVTEDTPIQEAIALMLENKYGCLPVVDVGGRLIGILTEGDFLRLVYQQVMGRAYHPTWEDATG
jgi:CBS domain-containing protein